MIDLKSLAAPEVLRKRLLVAAALDLILCPEEWLRYHHYIPQWAPGVTLAKIDNGAGDHLFALFTEDGTIIKGFDHESALSPHAGDEYEVWPGIYEEVPASLLSLLEAEELEKEEVTFCIWRENQDTVWRTGEVDIPPGEDDGSGFLLGTIFETAEDYADWAEAYFDMPIPIDIVTRFYEDSPITEEMVRLLNPERDTEEALSELKELGMRIETN